VARHMHGKMLDFRPGTNSKYSNYEYLLAGAVVEHVTGMKYCDYVKEMMLQLAGINEVEAISTLASQHNGSEAICEDQGLGISPLDLNSRFLVPAVYGGDGEINEVGDPNDGMGASAEALKQFIHLHAVWGQRSTSTWICSFGEHAGRQITRGLPRRWRRLGLRHQYVWLAAIQIGHTERPRNSITQLLDATALP